MNIALVVHDLHEHGGHSLYTRIMADELSRRHDVTVFANVCERPADAQWKFSRVRAWRQNALATVETFPIGMRAHAGALAQFQIQHSQGFCGGRPNVVTAHRCMAAYVSSLRSPSLRHRLSNQLMLAAEKRFYRNFEGVVIAVSQQIANELQDFYGIRGPVHVVPHGVDTNRFNGANRALHRDQVRNELGIGLSATVAFYAGDLTKAHVGLKELSRAAPDVQLLIATASTSYHWRAPNVRILPLTRTIERYYAAADAFVFPTVNDPFGMVALEAMAAGLPVFSSDRAGVAELITAGRDGFVAPLENWVEATKTALRDRDLLAQVGNEAEKTAQRHDWRSVASRVEQIYFEVAASMHPASVSGFSTDDYRHQQS